MDGVDFDPNLSLIKKSRNHILNNPRFDGIVLEEIAVRVPISLEPNHRRCTLTVVYETHGAYAKIFDEDSYFADVACITDEIDVHISGVDNLRLFCSPRSDYRVEAGQFSGELLDTVESQLQSSGCDMRRGVQWRSTNAKIGYRYEIPISAQRLADGHTGT
ncbi:MAG: hypothetical protein LC808_00550 [Actinobacteria bacterium]|nr:hypothetical protein [Actinomycetota bacterium]